MTDVKWIPRHPHLQLRCEVIQPFGCENRAQFIPLVVVVVILPVIWLSRFQKRTRCPFEKASEWTQGCSQCQNMRNFVSGTCKLCQPPSPASLLATVSELSGASWGLREGCLWNSQSQVSPVLHRPGTTFHRLWLPPATSLPVCQLVVEMAVSSWTNGTTAVAQVTRVEGGGRGNDFIYLSRAEVGKHNHVPFEPYPCRVKPILKKNKGSLIQVNVHLGLTWANSPICIN